MLEPLQIFFGGPAGIGKTFTLKLMMETINRYSLTHNSLINAYVATASTGKAASALDGTTGQSVFRIAATSSDRPLAVEMEQTYRGMFNGVRCVITDEISMLSSYVIHKVDARLKQITGTQDRNFGSLIVICCDDLRKLPPVRALPVFISPKQKHGGTALWQFLEYYQLTHVMRQSDDVLLHHSKIGCGTPLIAEETASIESRFTTLELCRENLKDAISFTKTST
jgi:hypothetical protein